MQIADFLQWLACDLLALRVFCVLLDFNFGVSGSPSLLAEFFPQELRMDRTFFFLTSYTLPRGPSGPSTDRGKLLAKYSPDIAMQTVKDVLSPC